jgi:putative phosphoesterase
MRVGVVSDTHGFLDPRALAALVGVEQILHAGDIGKPGIVDELAAIAPVIAIHGNVDAGTPLARRYPATRQVVLGGVRVYLNHFGGRPAELARALPTPRPAVYIFGHSHAALLETVDGVLFLNPGAAGRPRFGGGLSVALLDIVDRQATAQIVRL